MVSTTLAGVPFVALHGSLSDAQYGPTLPTLRDNPLISRRISTWAEYSTDSASLIMANPVLELRANAYAIENELTITEYLGGGEDGGVWATDQQMALKFCEREKNYLRELACYDILERNGIDSINGCDIPRLIGWDDDLLLIQMLVVKPPYILDFGKAHLSPPDYSPEVLADHEEKTREQWGHRIGEIHSIVWQLRQIGIYYLDTKPGNIVLPSIRGKS